MVDVPTLDVDQEAAKRGRTISHEGRMERRVVAGLIDHLKDQGYNPIEVMCEGETEGEVHDKKDAMEIVFNLDDSVIVFQGPDGDRHGVLLIQGNGLDIVSDYGVTRQPSKWNRAMDSFNPEEYA